MEKKLIVFIVLVALSQAEARNYTYDEIKAGFHKIINSTYEIFHNVSTQTTNSMLHIYQVTDDINVCLAGKNITSPVTLIPENLGAHLDSLKITVEEIKTEAFLAISKVVENGISTVFNDPWKVFESVGNDTVDFVDGVVGDLGEAVERFVENSCAEFKKPIYQLVERVNEIK